MKDNQLMVPLPTPLFDNPIRVVDADDGITVNIQRIYRYPNGYGASVIRRKMGPIYISYTEDETQWELAVVTFRGDRYRICNSTPIANDVIGYLSQQEVEELLSAILHLPLAPIVDAEFTKLDE